MTIRAAGGEIADLAIERVAVWDGRSAGLVENRSVAIKDGRFLAIADAKDGLPKSRTTIDGTGKWLIPGLIDMHVHYDDWHSHLFLSHGVTTIRDVANQKEWILLQREGERRGRIEGPRVFTCLQSLLIASGRTQFSVGTPYSLLERAADDPKEAARQTERRIESGADFIKVHVVEATPNQERVLEAIARVAHGAGLKLVAHTVDARVAVSSGVDCLEHSSGITRAMAYLAKRDDVLEQIPRFEGRHAMTFGGPLFHLLGEAERRATIAWLIERGTSVVPNLSLNGLASSQPRRDRYQLADTRLFGDVRLSYIPEYYRQWFLYGYYDRFGRFAGFENGQELMAAAYRAHESFVREFAAAGGRLLVGTDVANVVPGVGVARELELMVEAGVEPRRALMAATSDAADFLGQDQLGRIEPGALADCVLLDGNPLREIRAVGSIAAVIAKGRLIPLDPSRRVPNPIPRPPVGRPHGYPRPSIHALDPLAFTAGAATESIRVSGEGFMDGSVVYVDEHPTQTEFLDPATLIVRLPATVGAAVGLHRVRVRHPEPVETTFIGGEIAKGEWSNSAYFMVGFDAD